jgi:hypothetical protein
MRCALTQYYVSVISRYVDKYISRTDTNLHAVFFFCNKLCCSNHGHFRVVDEMPIDRIKRKSMEIGRNGILETVGRCSSGSNLAGKCLILQTMMMSRRGSSGLYGSFTNYL